MKIPSPVTGRTSPALASQSYTQGASNPGAGLNAIAKGANVLGDQFTDLGATLEQRNKQTDNFSALTKYSDFNTNVAAQLEELKRGYDPTGKGFTKAAEDLYTKAQQEFLTTQVPQDLQPEFKMRTEAGKGKVMESALAFQYQQGDAYFNQGISDELNKAKTVVDQNPSAIDAQQQHLNETIDSSGLPSDAKVKLKRDSSIALASIHYKTEVRSHAETTASLGVGPITDGREGAYSLIAGFEASGHPNLTPYMDHHTDGSPAGLRIGFGSDTITDANGVAHPVTAGMAITPEDAARDLKRRTVEFQSTIKGQVGEETFNNLPANVQAGLTSVAYNYGSLPSSVVDAVKQGDTGGIANAVLELSANPGRRADEAAVIRGTQGITADPRYANIPYEDKLALQKDAISEGTAAATQKAAQVKAVNDLANNKLFLGLLDGSAGQVDIDNARKNGTLVDYSKVAQAQEILKKRDGDQDLQASGVAKLGTPGAVWNPEDEKDKKQLNAIVGKEGINKIGSMDKDYVHDGIVPLVSQTGDIPTDVAGTLTGMLRGQNQQQAIYALDSMAQLQDANPVAFNQRFGSDTAKSVDLYQARKDLDPADVLLGKVRGTGTAQDRAAQLNLRKEGEDLLSHQTNGIPDAKSLLSTAVSTFGNFFSTPNTYTAPVAMDSFQKEFNTLFVDAYSQTGDKDQAVTIASKALHRDWAVTAVGAGNLMKYPPERAGYKAINGSYDWITDQVKAEFNAPDIQGAQLDEKGKPIVNPDGIQLAGAQVPHEPVSNFQLFSDEKTRQEIEAFKRDPSAPPPSYRVFTIDKDGVAGERKYPSGDPVRMNFQAPQALIQHEAYQYDYAAEKARLSEIITNHRHMVAHARANPDKVQVPEENTREAEAAQKSLDTLQATPAPNLYVPGVSKLSSPTPPLPLVMPGLGVTQ